MTKGLALEYPTLPPPTPPIPPPPKQHYFTASQVCQPVSIQGAAGNVAFIVTEASDLTQARGVPEIAGKNLRVMETLGEGMFGSIQICEMRGASGGEADTVLVKCLNSRVDESVREEFLQEAQVLSCINDINVAQLVGLTAQEPLCMIHEYLEHGDLHQFLRRHAPESTTGVIPRVAFKDGDDCPVLSYGALVYIATQVASGMKHLEKLNIVHRDLAARNCLVGQGLLVKVSDLAMSQNRYHRDYCRASEESTLLPVRWMAWESVLQGRFSSKSDVWAFGVTLWEILTLARQQPYAELSDDGVLENVSQCCHGDGSGMMVLPQPPLCPREMYDMMTACWRPGDRQRPPFWEVLMFLQRKNLGYCLDYPE